MNLVTVIVSVLCAAPPQGTTIDVWEKGAAPRAVALRGLPMVELTGDDAQYGGARTNRGVTLEALIAAAKPGWHLDTALLRFRNGMVVPVPFRQEALMRKLDLLVALELKTDGKWSAEFPQIPKPGAESRDRRPIVFAGNKVVVRTLFHPALPVDANDDASPWRYVDSLSGVEFVDGAAWNAQFSAGDDATVRQGEALFLGRCAFCHGVKKVGASWGWDLVEPIPLSEHRAPKSLWLHIKSRPADAPEAGLMMPAFRDVKEADAAALWKWMAAIAKTGPRPYAPRP